MYKILKEFSAELLEETMNRWASEGYQFRQIWHNGHFFYAVMELKHSKPKAPTGQIQESVMPAMGVV